MVFGYCHDGVYNSIAIPREDLNGSNTIGVISCQLQKDPVNGRKILSAVTKLGYYAESNLNESTNTSIDDKKTDLELPHVQLPSPCTINDVPS